MRAHRSRYYITTIALQRCQSSTSIDNCVYSIHCWFVFVRYFKKLSRLSLNSFACDRLHFLNMIFDKQPFFQFEQIYAYIAVILIVRSFELAKQLYFYSMAKTHCQLQQQWNLYKFKCWPSAFSIKSNEIEQLFKQNEKWQLSNERNHPSYLLQFRNDLHSHLHYIALMHSTLIHTE